ncbi:MAG: NAD(P)H-dependent oxidoreductase subunit E [Phycisphaerae bacterium]|nr:NAD(P)H-dependent oxidoreductase subunit E [Phycisphaerae bacterium]
MPEATEELCSLDRIDRIIDRYGGQRSALIQVLLDIQKEDKWLAEESLRHVASRLNVPLPQVYQVATFYKAFSLARRGRHLITVCMGTACHVRGSPRLFDRVSQKLGVGPGKTTHDGRFSLLTVNCMGCCALGPVLAIDEDYHSNPSAADLGRILSQYE